MLILTRKVSEAICIGDDAKIVVMDVCRNQVRLGIQATRDVTVDREEIAHREVRERESLE